MSAVSEKMSRIAAVPKASRNRSESITVEAVMRGPLQTKGHELHALRRAAQTARAADRFGEVLLGRDGVVDDEVAFALLRRRRGAPARLRHVELAALQHRARLQQDRG